MQSQRDRGEIDVAVPPGAAVRVAAVPGRHLYIRHLLRPGSDRVVVLPDPPALDGAVDRWWPPSMPTAAWVREHRADFDVMHLHFGLESSSERSLVELVEALQEGGKPLVVTVHDLDHPQLSDQAPWDRLLDVLVPAADRLLTLTPGAARRIRERWGRTAEVVAHPHVLPFDAAEPAPQDEQWTAAVHLRDLRPNIDGIGTVRLLAEAAAALPGARILVDVNERVRDAEQLEAVAAVVRDAPGLHLRQHPRSTDPELFSSLAAADAAVLPYRHGTHSGWAELCWDLGVPVLTAPVGFVLEQHPDDAVAISRTDPAVLAAALERVREDAPQPYSAARRRLVEQRRSSRRAQRDVIADRHEALYREVRA